MNIENNLKEAKGLLNDIKYSFVLMKEGQENIYSTDIGLKPIMVILRKDRLGLELGVVADKVIGKAAALMLVLSKASAVHAVVMSQAAKVILDENGITYTYDNLVPYIENRSQTGPCPLEECVESINEPELAYAAIEDTICQLMKNK